MRSVFWLCIGLVVALTTACADFGDFRVRATDASHDGATDDGDDADTRGDASDADTDGDSDGSVEDASMDDGGGSCMCGALEFCAESGTCEPKRANALDCTAQGQCLSNFCDPDGICCAPGEDCCDTDTECAGQYRCDTGARACFDACTAGNEAAACKGEGHCSAAGNCVTDLAPGAANACSRSTMCAGNANCVDGFCCNGSCSGCQACNLAGSQGVCGLASVGTDPRGACTASGCGNDGMCDGAGACRVVAAGTDPNGACTPSGCANDGMCNGTGACRTVPNQTPCGGTGSCGDNQCFNGACVDFCSSVNGPACTRCNFVWSCVASCG